MASPLEAQAVKSLTSNSSGRRRFAFKTFSQRLEDINIDVYRSLHPLNPEPTPGSSFFRDCMVEWRELNTAEEFISFYEEMLPLVQTLPHIILQKEVIISKLLSILQYKARMSLEPILRLISALSRDLVQDFVPFLQRIADCLVSLLKSGADRDPEIIEQIFTSLSYIIMYLQKYLVRDVVHVLKVTVELRYYPKEYIQEFMTESLAFLLRNAQVEQLVKGIRKVIFEAVKKPLEMRKSSVCALLFYTMRGTTSNLHSRTEQVFSVLMDKSTFIIGNKLTEGSDIVVEVVIATFQRLCEELEPASLNFVWEYLNYEVAAAVRSETLHLSRLLSLLVATLQKSYIRKLSDYGPLLELVALLVHACVVDSEKQSSEIIGKVMQLMLCILDGLQNSGNTAALVKLPLEWSPIFKLRNSSLFTFTKELLSKDRCLPYSFRVNILKALNDSVEASVEEVVYLLLIFFERLHEPCSSLLDGETSDHLANILNLSHETISNWIQAINDKLQGNPSCLQIQENKLALLYGVVKIFPYVTDVHSNSTLLMDLVDAVDQLLLTDSGNIAGITRDIWTGLIGCCLGSYIKLHCVLQIRYAETSLNKLLNLARRYKMSSQILSAVADFLDIMDESTSEVHTSYRKLHPELQAEKALDALAVFGENLSHKDKRIRLSTLRILCHYGPLTFEDITSTEKKMKIEVPQNVLHLLLSIEETPLSVTCSKKVTLLISKIQMDLTAARIPEPYIPILLNGIIGIFHYRFRCLWNSAVECLAVIIGRYPGIAWERCIQYLTEFQSNFLADEHQSVKSINASSSECHDLVTNFNLFLFPHSDGTPCGTVLSLLIQSLQKVSTIAEARSSQIIPVFLRFLGYICEVPFSVKSYMLQCRMGKEWKVVLGDWLTLLKTMRNPELLCFSQFLKEVLVYRLLDSNDADLQMKVLDCLFNWKDGFLQPYEQHLKNLVSSNFLREELATWSFSRESNLIDEHHRPQLVPLVLRVLVPKIRNLKTLASRKHASVRQREAVLGFLAKLDIEELTLFFALLINPLQTISHGIDTVGNRHCSPKCSSNDINSKITLTQFTMNDIRALSWKKKNGLLHVIEDILGVFDVFHIKPFLNLLMGYVVQLLASCPSSHCTKTVGTCPGEKNYTLLNASEKDSGGEKQSTTAREKEKFKSLRSLCLKILSVVLTKYEDHDFGSEFWDLFCKSVQCLIGRFKQETSSSEKPSSLFYCFIAISRSRKLVSLLNREQMLEKKLLPDIFSILKISKASDAIISCVLKFTENLLILDDEQESDDKAIRSVLGSNLEILICSLHCIFTCTKAPQRKLVKCPGKQVLNIFKLLTKYIDNANAATKFVDMLLPLLIRQPKNCDEQLEILHVIQHLDQALESEITAKIVRSVSPLLISATPDVRLSVCDLLKKLSQNDNSLFTVAHLLHKLNAPSTSEMGGLDYDTVIGACDNIRLDFFYSVREEHALVILSHFVHEMSSEELIMRQSAFRAMLLFVDFCVQILDQEVEPETEGFWSRACILRFINKFLLKYMGRAMNKEATVQKVWINLLREMVLRLSKVPTLQSLQVLCSKDAEQDFFNNVVHLQKHRRARALARFSSVVSSCNLSQVITNKVFVPLLFNILFNVQHGKEENLRSASIEALASISGCMDWNDYCELLNRCFREMSLKPDKQKLFLRLISSILDHYHFMGSVFDSETRDSATVASKHNTFGTSALIVLRKCNRSVELSDMQAWLYKKLLPKIQKLLTADSDSVNMNTNVVALKLLKLLPSEIMELQLPNIVHRISNSLKSRMESIRDEARCALAACLKELGLEYLQLIVKVLRATLKRGFEMHVLGYTLNFILSKCLPSPVCGKLDYCLGELLCIAENDILGDVSEEKEVEKIASKMKETRTNKSFETLRLIAQSITFKTHALELLSHVTIHFQKHLTPKSKLNLESMLHHIAAGIRCNPSVDQTDLFIFTYSLLEDGLTDDNWKGEVSTIAGSKQNGDKEDEMTASKLLRYAYTNPRCSHIIAVFALGILYNHMKNAKLHKTEVKLLSLLDPFVRLLGYCLTSKYEDVISASLRCLSQLVHFPLPSLEHQADKIKFSLLVIARESVDPNSPVMQSCIRLLTVLLRSTKVTLSSDHLHMLIHFPLFLNLKTKPSVLALSLLKAIISRKLVVPDIYDLVTQVAELMVTSQVEPIRKKCSQIWLQFLLDYNLSEDHLQQHLDSLSKKLSYEHSTGREAALEMFHAIIMKFPRSVLDRVAQAVFLKLVLSLANDNDQKVRSMAGAAIKVLVGRVSRDRHLLILEYSLSWYMGGISHLWSAAAQVVGLLVEVMMKGFRRHLDSVFPVMRDIFQSAVDVFGNKQLDFSGKATITYWKEAYYSLVLLEKIMHHFPECCLGTDLEDIWEMICKFLLHPHMWLRNISNRLIALYFSAATEACRGKCEKSLEAFLLMRPGRLFLVAVSLCCQLRGPLADDMAKIIIEQNLVFSVNALHALLKQNEYTKLNYWFKLEHHERDLFCKTFHMLDSRKGQNMFASLTSGVSGQNDQDSSRQHSSLLVSYLLKRLGKSVFEMETIQMKIVFNAFRSISPKIFDSSDLLWNIVEDNSQNYAYQMLVPLYKVCEGFAGKVIPDDVKQSAEDACESIKSSVGAQNFVHVYSQVRKHLKAKRDERRREEKLMAVINPVRHAKRKLRVSAKHRENKKRKVMTMKMGRWNG